MPFNFARELTGVGGVCPSLRPLLNPGVSSRCLRIFFFRFFRRYNLEVIEEQFGPIIRGIVEDRLLLDQLPEPVSAASYLAIRQVERCCFSRKISRLNALKSVGCVYRYWKGKFFVHRHVIYSGPVPLYLFAIPELSSESKNI